MLSHHGGGERCLQLALQLSSEYPREMVTCEKVVKINRTLMVTLSHPYIGAENHNDFREVRRHLRELLEIVCTMEMKPKCALVR